MARRVEQVAAAGDPAKIRTLYLVVIRGSVPVRVADAEANPVEQVESFGAELKSYRFSNREVADYRNVLVVIGELPHCRNIAGCIAKPIQAGARSLNWERTVAIRR